MLLTSSESKQLAGVIITGGVGTGKTAIIEQLVESSLFERRKTELVFASACDGNLQIILFLYGVGFEIIG